MLFAIPIGVGAGYLLGGRLEALWNLRFRWAGLAIVGLVVQLALFSDPVAAIVGGASPVIYVASTGLVVLVLLRNLAIPGVGVIALGAGLNLIAVLANGGAMPVDPAALAAVGPSLPASSNAVITAEPAFRVLTDVFAMPTWLPLTNVFSIGDVVIAIGIAITVAMAMRARPAATAGSNGEVAATE